MARSGFKSWAVDNQGNVLGGTQIEVRRTSDNALASLFDAASGGNALTNPFNAETDGSFEFYTDQGRYNLIVGVGGNAQTIPLDLLDARVNVAFTSRDDFVAHIAGGGDFDNGTAIIAGGLSYLAQSGSTAIPNLPGMVPDGIGQPEHFGALGDSQGLDAPAPSGTDDGAALAAFFAWLPGNHGAFNAAKIYRTDQLFQISGDNYTLDLNNATLDARNAPETGTIIGQTGSIAQTISGITIATSTDSNQNQTVTVTAANHGLSFGDVVLLHSDDAVDIGYDATNETRGQFSTVRTVVDANTFTIVEPLYQTLPTNPRMAVINWRENFRWMGDFTILGRGRRAGADTNPALVGQIGISLTYCRNFQIGRTTTKRVDQQTVAVDNCVDGFINRHSNIFDVVADGTDGAIQYGVTFKNACTRITVDGINSKEGRHGAFDWTRNTNPGVGRDCVIQNVSADGGWRTALAMHGNAQNCVINNVRVKNALDGVEIRAPGWTVTDVYGEDLRFVVRLTDDPKRTVLRNIRGDNVVSAVRFVAGTAGYIGVDPLKDIVMDGVFGNEVSQNTVFVDASLPVFTQASAAVSAGTTTSMTVPDFSNALYNNAGACTGWELVCDPDGGGSATEFTRTVTHTRSGGNNVFTWTTPVGTAPVSGLATYSLRGFADDITITNVKSRNCLFPDIAITAANHRGLTIRGLDVSSEAMVAQAAILIQGTSDSHVRDVSISGVTNRNKNGPAISANTLKVDFLDGLTPEIFNAAGDGEANDTSALQAAVTFANTMSLPLVTNGDYLTTASIDNLHEVTKVGTGTIRRGSDTFQITNRETATNIIYTSPSGATTNDGLSASEPVAIQSVEGVLTNYGPTLGGNWVVQLAAGVFTQGLTLVSAVTQNDVTVRGPSASRFGGTATAGTATTITIQNPPPPLDVDDSLNGFFIEIVDGTGTGQVQEITDFVAATNVVTVGGFTTAPDNTSIYKVFELPTAVIDGTSATSDIGIALRDNTKASIEHVLVRNFSDTGIDLGAGGELDMNNVHLSNNTDRGLFTRGNTIYRMNGGRITGSVRGIHELFGVVRTVSWQSTDLTNSTTISGNTHGIFAKEHCTGHADNSFIDGNTYGAQLHRGATCNFTGTRITNNDYGIYSVGGHFVMTATTDYGIGTPAENAVANWIVGDPGQIGINSAAESVVQDPQVGFVEKQLGYFSGSNAHTGTTANTEIASLGTLQYGGFAIEGHYLRVKLFGFKSGTAGACAMRLQFGGGFVTLINIPADATNFDIEFNVTAQDWVNRNATGVGRFSASATPVVLNRSNNSLDLNTTTARDVSIVAALSDASDTVTLLQAQAWCNFI